MKILTNAMNWVIMHTNCHFSCIETSQCRVNFVWFRNFCAGGIDACVGTTGPCPAGHLFQIPYHSNHNQYAECQCKEGYTTWSDGQCYRLYTRGPCGAGEFLVNSTTCIRNPCGKGRLYFPGEKTCYRIGSQGPCDLSQVVVFDFTVRPSIDGVSYNGVCGCSGIIKSLDQKCEDDEETEDHMSCHAQPGMVLINGDCFKLYTQGPCADGLWLEPIKIVKRDDKRGAHCTCRPGYTKYESTQGITGCYAPSVSIARYLNGKNFSILMHGDEFVSSFKSGLDRSN